MSYTKATHFVNEDSRERDSRISLTGGGGPIACRVVELVAEVPTAELVLPYTPACLELTNWRTCAPSVLVAWYWLGMRADWGVWKPELAAAAAAMAELAPEESSLMAGMVAWWGVPGKDGCAMGVFCAFAWDLYKLQLFAQHAKDWVVAGHMPKEAEGQAPC